MAKFTLHLDGITKFHQESKVEHVLLVVKQNGDTERACLFYLDITVEMGMDAYKYRQDFVCLASIGSEFIFVDNGKEYTIGFVEDDPDEIPIKGWESLAECASISRCLDKVLEWLRNN